MIDPPHITRTAARPAARPVSAAGWRTEPDRPLLDR
jgi:hypothetical protein